MNTGTIVANERLTTFLSSDTEYTKVFGHSFMVKAKCRASMSTREIHELEVSLDVTPQVVNMFGLRLLAELVWTSGHLVSPLFSFKFFGVQFH